MSEKAVSTEDCLCLSVVHQDTSECHVATCEGYAENERGHVMLHKRNEQRGVDTPSQQGDDSDKENSVAIVDNEKTPKETGHVGQDDEAEVYPIADLGLPSIVDKLDMVILRLRIQNWQSAFPEDLPAPEDFSDFRDQAEAASGSSTGGQRWCSSDYIVPLTEDEAARIPKYYRGRLAFAEINELANSFNDTLEAKYRLLIIPMRHVPSSKYAEVIAYRQQETTETKHRRFLTEDDLVGKARGFNSRRTAASFFAVMRHCGRIQEIRGPGKISRFAVK